MYSFDFRLFTISSILFVSITCLIIILLDIKNETERNRSLKYKLVLYYTTHILTNTGFILYFYNVEALLWYNWLFMLNIVSIPVMFYAFIFSITTTSDTERFPRYHYIVPITLSIIMLTLSIIIPQEEQLIALSGNGSYVSGSVLFYVFSRKLAFRLVFALFYLVLIIKRLKPYRTYIGNYSSNESKSSLNWLPKLLFLIATLFIIPISGLFTSRTGLAAAFTTQIQALLLTLKLCYLTFHVLKKHYIPQEDSPVNDKTTTTYIEENDTLDKSILNRIDFDNYINSQKPYLEPNLKITDIAENLNVKRNSLSNFINTEYGVNFSNFINNLRLIEYYQLRSNPNYNHKSNIELSEKAGFGSYRTCTRYAANAEKK